MEANRRSVKRKPFSDLTNFNLVPTSTRRKLCSTSSSLSSSPLFSKPPNRIPNPNPKPYNSFTKNKPDTNSSKSDTSIGSSNFNNAPNPTTVSQSHPSTHPPIPPSHSSSANPGNGDDGILEPRVVYGRRQTSEKTKNKGKAVAVPFSCPPVLEKTTDKGNTDAVSLSHPRLEKTTNKENTDVVSFRFPPLEKTKDKGKAVYVTFTSPLVEKPKDKGQAIDVPLNCPHLEKTKFKGKAVDVPFSCLPLETTKDKGKAVPLPFGCTPSNETKDKGKAIAVPFSFPSLEETKDQGKLVSVPFSCPPLLRTRNFRNELKEAGDTGQSKSWTDPHPKHKKKRRRVPPDQDVSRDTLPLDFIEQQRAYFKEVDEFELPEEEVSFDEFIKEEKV